MNDHSFEVLTKVQMVNYWGNKVQMGPFLRDNRGVNKMAMASKNGRTTNDLERT
jgi:hypothetical protein